MGVPLLVKYIYIEPPTYPPLVQTTGDPIKSLHMSQL